MMLSLKLPPKNSAVDFTSKGYRMVEFVGRGQFGRAYRVECLEDGSEWLAKTIDMSSLSDRDKIFSLQEAAVMQHLRHPGIVRWRESFMHDEMFLVIVMEYCAGGDLTSILEHRIVQQDYMSEDEGILLLASLAETLNYIHNRCILHRDIKPSNVFIGSNGFPKLGDFGISRMLENVHASMAKTNVGTPQYMSPEMCEGCEYTYKSDMWALGCVAYEALALQTAFDAPSFLALVLAICTKSPPPLSDRYSSEIRELVISLLAKQPKDRPSAAEVLVHPTILAWRRWDALRVYIADESWLAAVVDAAAKSADNNSQCVPSFPPLSSSPTLHSGYSGSLNETELADWLDSRVPSAQSDQETFTQTVQAPRERRKSLGTGLGLPPSQSSAYLNSLATSAVGIGGTAPTVSSFSSASVIARFHEAACKHGALSGAVSQEGVIERLAALLKAKREGESCHCQSVSSCGSSAQASWTSASKDSGEVSADASSTSTGGRCGLTIAEHHELELLLQQRFADLPMSTPLSVEVLTDITLRLPVMVSKQECALLYEHVGLAGNVSSGLPHVTLTIADFVAALSVSNWKHPYLQALRTIRRKFASAIHSQSRGEDVVAQLRNSFAWFAVGCSNLTLTSNAFKCCLFLHFPHLTGNDLANLLKVAAKNPLTANVLYEHFLCAVDIASCWTCATGGMDNQSHQERFSVSATTSGVFSDTSMSSPSKTDSNSPTRESSPLNRCDFLDHSPSHIPVAVLAQEKLLPPRQTDNTINQRTAPNSVRFEEQSPPGNEDPLLSTPTSTKAALSDAQPDRSRSREKRQQGPALPEFWRIRSARAASQRHDDGPKAVVSPKTTRAIVTAPGMGPRPRMRRSSLPTAQDVWPPAVDDTNRPYDHPLVAKRVVLSDPKSRDDAASTAASTTTTSGTWQDDMGSPPDPGSKADLRKRRASIGGQGLQVRQRAVETRLEAAVAVHQALQALQNERMMSCHVVAWLLSNSHASSPEQRSIAQTVNRSLVERRHTTDAALASARKLTTLCYHTQRAEEQCQIDGVAAVINECAQIIATAQVTLTTHRNLVDKTIRQSDSPLSGQQPKITGSAQNFCRASLSRQLTRKLTRRLTTRTERSTKVCEGSNDDEYDGASNDDDGTTDAAAGAGGSHFEVNRRQGKSPLDAAQTQHGDPQVKEQDATNEELLLRPSVSGCSTEFAECEEVADLLGGSSTSGEHSGDVDSEDEGVEREFNKGPAILLRPSTCWSVRFLVISGDLTDGIAALLGWLLRLLRAIGCAGVNATSIGNALQLQELLASQRAFLASRQPRESLRNDWDAARFFMGLVVARKTVAGSTFPTAVTDVQQEPDSNLLAMPQSTLQYFLATWENRLLHSTDDEIYTKWNAVAEAAASRLAASLTRHLRGASPKYAPPDPAFSAVSGATMERLPPRTPGGGNRRRRASTTGLFVSAV